MKSFPTTPATPLPHLASGGRLKILFAVASWGLGHATRDLPLIQRMLDQGHDVTVVSCGRALSLLQQELRDRCAFLEWPDLPHGLARSAPLFYAKFALSLPLALRAIIAENRAVESLLTRSPYDRIVSDTRYGVRSPRVQSFQVSHGLRFIAPRRTQLLETMMDYIYFRCFGPSTNLIVPDFETDGLSGDLAHNPRFLAAERLSYIGILSGVRRQSFPTDIDCYVSISGPEPQRTILEKLILKQASQLPGRIVISLGKPEEAGQAWARGKLMVYSYVNRRQQQELMNRAKLIVSRSGYTTMMELAELGKPALLIPTPGQTEQEYLAALHRRRGTYYSVSQNRLNLPRDLSIAAGHPGFQPTHGTDESVSRFMRIIEG